MADRVLRPQRLELSPDSPSASRDFQHWMFNCEDFLKIMVLPKAYEKMINADFSEEQAMDLLKLQSLMNLVSSDIWMDIKDCSTFDEAKKVLTDTFVKTPSTVYARYKLITSRQTPKQSLKGFKRELEQLSRNCNFEAVDASKYKDDMLLQAFIAGIYSHEIRKRLLEEKVFYI